MDNTSKKIAVITGSTTGIGFGLAQSLALLGCGVTISGRNQERVDQALARLSSPDAVGITCDVASFEQVQSLWDLASGRFGRIDIWINNAGTISAQTPFMQQEEADIRSMVDTNLKGSMYGSKVALQGMLKQGFGQIYNMEGYGSDGSKRNGMALYGSTKCGVRYFTKSIAKEMMNGPVRICTLSPGIVITDLLAKSYKDGTSENLRWAKRVFHVMADDCTTVCNWLAREILKNNSTGRRIAWLTPPRILHHILLAPFRKRNPFP